MKVQQMVIAVSLMIGSSSVLAWGNYANGSASAGVTGYNSVQANSHSRGNGSAFNAAWSGTELTTKTRVTGFNRYNCRTRTHSLGVNTYALDTKDVYAGTQSERTGNGNGSASASAQARGHANTGSYVRYTSGYNHYSRPQY